MKARWRLVCLAGATCAALTLPAGAGAKPGYEVRSGSFQLHASLPGHHGFSYTISAPTHHRVRLVVAKRGALVTYTAKGRASSRRVHADFGPLGHLDFKIDVDRAGSPPFRAKHGRCTTKPPLLLAGKFRGSIRFEGEPGVRGLTTHRGRVSVKREFKTVCKKRHRHRHHRRRRNKGNRKKIEADLLFAKSRSKGRKVEFGLVNLSLQTNPPFSFAFLTGNVSERLGRVRISRSVFEIAEEVVELSKLGSDPETATVRPPRPFRGAATYTARSRSTPTWTGNLRVHLPGAGTVPLAGRRFRAKLCRTFSAAALNRCFQGSGPHPQALAEARLPFLKYLRGSSS
jgi:hypothetical protein